MGFQSGHTLMLVMRLGSAFRNGCTVSWWVNKGDADLDHWSSHLRPNDLIYRHMWCVGKQEDLCT